MGSFDTPPGCSWIGVRARLSILVSTKRAETEGTLITVTRTAIVSLPGIRHGSRQAHTMHCSKAQVASTAVCPPPTKTRARTPRPPRSRTQRTGLRNTSSHTRAESCPCVRAVLSNPGPLCAHFGAGAEWRTAGGAPVPGGAATARSGEPGRGAANQGAGRRARPPVQRPSGPRPPIARAGGSLWRVPRPLPPPWPGGSAARPASAPP